MAELNRTCGIRISLLLDLSATPAGRFYVDDEEGEVLAEPYLAALQRTVNSIKNLEQQGERSDIIPSLPSLLDKTYSHESAGVVLVSVDVHGASRGCH